MSTDIHVTKAANLLIPSPFVSSLPLHLFFSWPPILSAVFLLHLFVVSKHCTLSVSLLRFAVIWHFGQTVVQCLCLDPGRIVKIIGQSGLANQQKHSKKVSCFLNFLHNIAMEYLHSKLTCLQQSLFL